MFRNFLRLVGVPALAAATLLGATSLTEARPRRGVEVLVVPGVSAGYGYYQPYSQFYGGTGYYPGYRYGNYEYSPRSSFSPRVTVTYGDDTTYSQRAPSSQTYSFYPPNDATESSSGVDPNAVLFRVHVPADADLWFDGERTSQAGSVREFATPPLTPGKEYSYDLRARWMQNGQPVEQQRVIAVHAGDHLNLDLTAVAPRAENKTNLPPGPLQEETTPRIVPRRTDEGAIQSLPSLPGSRSSRPIP